MSTSEEFETFCDELCLSNVTANYTICTEQRFVDCVMYPKRILDLEYLVPATVFLVLIFLTGLLGNLCVCTVIIKHPNLRFDTNLYLFSLAVSDILLLVFATILSEILHLNPSQLRLDERLVIIAQVNQQEQQSAGKLQQGLLPELWSYWEMYPYEFGEFTCRLSSFLASTATWASALVVVAFSIERYTAICHAARFRSRDRRRVWMAIAAVWIISLASALPDLHVFHVVVNPYWEYPGTGKASPLAEKCQISGEPQYAYYGHLISITTIVFFFVPMAILTLMYTKIALFIITHRHQARKNGITNNCIEDNKIFKVLVAVVVAFFVCGAPYHYQRISAATYVEDQDYQRKVFVLTALLYYLSATINPILYNAMSKRYRNAFKDIILRSKKQDGAKPFLGKNKKHDTATTIVTYTEVATD